MHTNSCMCQQFSGELNVRIRQFAAVFVKNLPHYMGNDDRVPELSIRSFGYMYLADNDGDEVLMRAPYFGRYKDIVLILGGQAEALECPAESGFRLRPTQFEAATTPKTRWIILNLPSNPAGAVYSDEDLRELGAVLAKHPDVLILSYEIYEHILFDGRTFLSFAAANSSLKDQSAEPDLLGRLFSFASRCCCRAERTAR